MIHDERLELRRERDFGDVINVTFQFLRQNLIPLGKSLLYIVGPAALLLGLASAGVVSLNPFDPLESADPANVDPAQMGALMLLYMIVMSSSLVTLALVLTVVNSYILLYQDRGGSAASIEDVWQVVKKEFWGMLGTLLLVSCVLMGVYIAILFPIIFAVMIGTVVGSSLFTGIVMVIAVIAGLGGLMYFLVTYSLVFAVRLGESATATAALRRCHFLIKGHWWSTFLVVFITYLLMGILGLLFNIPRYAVSFSGIFFSATGESLPWFWWPLLVASIIGTLGSSLLYAIPMSAAMLQYYNLVEQKEHKGLLDRIDERYPDDDGDKLTYDRDLF